MSDNRKIRTGNYQYKLPRDRIARYPLKDRDSSRMLVYRDGMISHRIFRDLPAVLPGKVWMAMNNTRVIQARLSFRKPTGAEIEVFCLEPADPPEYTMVFGSRGTCVWKCLVGNARKWKSGPVALHIPGNGYKLELQARLLERLQDGFLVRFSWDAGAATFGEIIEMAGKTPIPPYLEREAEEEDRQRYQTVYGLKKGSVAAPTAGLHFTDSMMQQLQESGIEMKKITLHVGAGTFAPVKHEDARQHAMHAEQVQVGRSFLDYWRSRPGGLVAVGTTTTRSLETMYWLGIQLLSGQSPDPARTVFHQWENESLPQDIPLKESLDALHEYFVANGLDSWSFITSLMVVPGYRFRTISGLVTNFHMPGSTLLMLIAALIGEDWKRVYHEALQEGYRFLSYGDSSLLIP